MKTVLIRFAWLPLLVGQLALAQTAPPQSAALNRAGGGGFQAVVA